MDWMFWPFFGLIGILSVGFLALWIWALVDCIQVPDDSMYQSGNKLIWVLIIVFVNWIGAILYLLIGRPRGGREKPAAAGPPSPGPLPASGEPGSLPPPPGSP
jgi:hypothetical protein